MTTMTINREQEQEAQAWLEEAEANEDTAWECAEESMWPQAERAAERSRHAADQVRAIALHTPTETTKTMVTDAEYAADQAEYIARI